jgi:hypothetical protein
VHALQQPQHGRLAAPRRPDERHRRPGRDVDVERVERPPAAGTAVVREAHPLERHPPGERGRRTGVRHVGRLLLGVEHREHRAERHARLAQRRVHLDEERHRREHAAHVPPEREQPAQRQPAAHHEPPAVAEDHGARGQLGEARRGGDLRIHVHAAVDAGERPARAPHEPPLLVPLVREGAHRAHAVQHLVVPRPQPREEALVRARAGRLRARGERGDARRDGHEAEHRDGDRALQPQHPPRGHAHVHERRTSR